MLHEKIKLLRKQKGITQEELAIRLHIVRQTVSKWEQGLSVPDAEMLIKLAEVFEVTTSELLGTDDLIASDETEQNKISEQLSRINEQLAIRNKRGKLILKVVLGILIGTIVLYGSLSILGFLSYGMLKTDGSGPVLEQVEVNPSTE